MTAPNRGGAPKGNTNALKSGRHTAEMRAFRLRVRLALRRLAYSVASARQELQRLRMDAPVARCNHAPAQSVTTPPAASTIGISA